MEPLHMDLFLDIYKIALVLYWILSIWAECVCVSIFFFFLYVYICGIVYARRRGLPGKGKAASKNCELLLLLLLAASNGTVCCWLAGWLNCCCCCRWTVVNKRVCVCVILVGYLCVCSASANGKKAYIFYTRIMLCRVLRTCVWRPLPKF